jgi:hypothetical protein
LKRATLHRRDVYLAGKAIADEHAETITCAELSLAQSRIAASCESPFVLGGIRLARDLPRLPLDKPIARAFADLAPRVKVRDYEGP